MRAALPLLLLAACNVQAIPVHMTYATAEEREIVEEAASRLGYGVDWRESNYGAVAIDVIRDGSGRADGKHRDWFCHRVIWTEEDIPTVMHELGHALGLQHVCHENNFMHEWALVDKVEDWQRDTMDAGLRRLRLCGGR